MAAAPGHYGPHDTITANVLPEWQQNTGTRFGVVGKDDWKVSPLTSLVRGIQFNTGAGWSDGVYSVYDSTNITAPYSLPVTSETKYFMIVSRADWQEPFTRVFTHVEGTADRALPLNAVDYYRNVGVRADFPVALVQVPANSLDLGEIIDLRVCRGDNGWLIANDVLALQYLDRDGTVVEIAGTIYRRLNGLWDVIGHTNEPLVDPYRHLALNTPFSIGSAADGTDYKTVVGFKAGRGDGGNAFPLTYSNGVVTVGQSGTYVLDGQLTFNSGPASTRVAAFNVSGVRYRNWGANIGSRHTLPLHKELRLEAGTTVSMQAWQNSGSSIPLIGDDDQTTWTIRRVGR